MPKVLILEDEVALRSSMARGIGKMPGIEILEAGTVDEACYILDTTLPDLILSDIDLPDRLGIEILGELGQRSISIPVVFISAYLKAYRAQIPPNANVDVREKPVSLQGLRDIVDKYLGASAEVPEPSPFTVADYLQIACMGGHSVKIDVLNDQNDPTGTVLVVNGGLWHAQDTQGTGTDAFGRVAFQSGVVVCKTLKGDPGARTIDADWQSLLLDAARVHDESSLDPQSEELDLEGGFLVGPDEAAPKATTDSEKVPPPIQQNVTDKTPEDVIFEEMWEQGVEALLVKDYETAIRTFLELRELRPEDQKIEANLNRLAEMGVYDPDAPLEVDASELEVL